MENDPFGKILDHISSLSDIHALYMSCLILQCADFVSLISGETASVWSFNYFFYNKVNEAVSPSMMNSEDAYFTYTISISC
jgi:hypothetical protein